MVFLVHGKAYTSLILLHASLSAAYIDYGSALASRLYGRLAGTSQLRGITKTYEKPRTQKVLGTPFGRRSLRRLQDVFFCSREFTAQFPGRSVVSLFSFAPDGH